MRRIWRFIACVMNNMHDMRAAIDEAMRLDPELYAAIDQARGKAGQEVGGG